MTGCGYMGGSRNTNELEGRRYENIGGATAARVGPYNQAMTALRTTDKDLENRINNNSNKSDLDFRTSVGLGIAHAETQIERNMNVMRSNGENTKPLEKALESLDNAKTNSKLLDEPYSPEQLNGFMRDIRTDLQDARVNLEQTRPR